MLLVYKIPGTDWHRCQCHPQISRGVRCMSDHRLVLCIFMWPYNCTKLKSGRKKVLPSNPAWLAMSKNLYLLSLALATASLVLGAVPIPLNHFEPQFVKTVGTQFTLDGSKFTVVGCGVVSKTMTLRRMWPVLHFFFCRGNAYWVGLTGLSVADMNKAFADIAKAGGTAVRFALSHSIQGASSRISMPGTGQCISQNFLAFAI